MQFEGALLTEQNVKFAIVIVKQYVLNSQSESSKAMHAFQPCFPDAHIVLMAQDGRGVPTYRGRRDIVAFLANIHVSRIPWKRYTF